MQKEWHSLPQRVLHSFRFGWALSLGGSCTIYRGPDFEKWVRQFSCFSSQAAGVSVLALPLDYAILYKFYSLSVLQFYHLQNGNICTAHLEELLSIEPAVICVIYSLRAAAWAQFVTMQSSHIESCRTVASLKNDSSPWFIRIKIHLSLLPSAQSLGPLGLFDYFRELHVSRIYANCSVISEKNAL